MALIQAACRGDLDAICQLALSNMLVVDEFDETGKTALMHAAGLNNTLLVSSLLAFGADPKRVDGAGCSPLTYAAASGSLDIAKTLVNAGAEVGYICISKAHNLEMLQYLLSHPKITNLNKIINTLGTPVLFEFLQVDTEEQLEMLREVLKHGADPNGANADLETPLQFTTKIMVEMSLADDKAEQVYWNSKALRMLEYFGATQ